MRIVSFALQGSAACLCALLLAACGGSSGPEETSDATLARASATGHTLNPPSFSPNPPSWPTPLPSPRISIAPTDATVGLGAGVSFGVYAVGTGTLTYQWLKDGVRLVGKTARILEIGSTTQQSAGRYAVEVRDGLGQKTTTTPVTLTVVSGGWAPLGGRPIYPAPFMKQPALAHCGKQPTVAHLLSSNGRTTLYVHYFDGIAWRHFGAGGILNATATGHASDPSIECVGDGITTWPVVAWSEGADEVRNVYVRYFDGKEWVPLGNGALNANANSRAVKPTLRVTPLDPNTGNTLHQGLTLRSTIAWIENGVPNVRQWSTSGWKALAGGAQIPGASNARDIALAIEFDEQGGTYPPVVAWLQASSGVHKAYAATHNAGLGSWISMGAPIGDGQNPLPDALLKGRIGVGVGKYAQGRQPLVMWANASAPYRFESHMYPSGSFVNGVANDGWMKYADTFTAGTIESTSFDPLEFRRTDCTGFFNLPTFGYAIAHDTGFEVRRGSCNSAPPLGNPAKWDVIHTAHNVVLKEISLRMMYGNENDPYVAGTRLVNGSYQLSVWKYYP